MKPSREPAREVTPDEAMATMRELLREVRGLRGELRDAREWVRATIAATRGSAIGATLLSMAGRLMGRR